jgi:cation diffusion facilitator family transporter
MSSPDRFREALRAGRVSVLANVVFAAVKLLAGVLGHSYALIADAMESILDIGGSLGILGGLRIASQPPDERFPYGHGKAEPLAAAALAVLMIGAAIGLAVESVHNIRTPHQLPAVFTLFVLAVVIVVKIALSRYLHRVAMESQSTAVQVDAWHHWADVLTSCAAFIGISIAVWNGPGYEAADDWAALVACGIIAVNGFQLLRPAVGDIMDAAPSEELEKSIREVAGAVPGVLGVEKCFIRKYGLSFVVDLHVEVDSSLTVVKAHAISHHVKDALRASNMAIADVLVHIEPAPDSG